MAFLLRLCGLLLITVVSAFWGRAEDPLWMPELKLKCVGAKDQYYVDDVERRCCKCTPCEDYSHPREIQCDSPNNCQTKYSSDCVYESKFDVVFNQPVLTIAVTDPWTPTKTTKDRAETEMSNSTVPVISKTVIIELSDAGSYAPPDNPSLPLSVVMSVTAICVTVLVLLVVVLWRWRKCGDTGNGSLMKLMHMCKGDKSSDSKDRDKAKSGDEEEGKCLVRTEEPAAMNGSPPQPPSEFGPAAMPVHPDLQYGINSRNEGLSGRSFDTSGSYRDSCEERSSIPRPSGGFSSQMQGMPFSIDRNNMPQTAPTGSGSVNSGIVTSGNGNFALVQATGGATVNIHNAEFRIVYPSHPPDNLDQSDGQNVAITVTPHVQQEQPSQLPSPQLPLASESSRGDEDVRSNPCFPSRTGGEFVTSVSTPLSERENCIRRQSSQISSTSSGPVENGSEDYESEKSVPKELSRVQESCYPTYQSQSSGSASASIRTSSSRGPVQHSSNGESLPYNHSDHLSQENSSLTTGVVHSPQADLAESM